jgi:hypothetical protein
MRNENNYGVLELAIGFAIVILVVGGISILIYTAPPAKTIEQQRIERAESYHEAGKDIHEFIKGAIGK